ncbi:MAG: hypothetical protein EXR75_16360 [Myxococcales bacterium]|nr:hypothetical protein [Myxococcales bacterium]
MDGARSRSHDPRAHSLAPALAALVVRALVVVAVLAVALGVWTARVIVAGESELERSTRALEAGDAHEAVVCARRAARWYAPGAPHVSSAYRRLIALARQAELHRRREIALLAWSAVRSAALETRWLVTPHHADLALAELEIARINALPVHDRGPLADSRVRAELEAMRRHEPPRAGWVVALVGGLATMATALVLFAKSAASAGGRIELRRGWKHLLAAALGATAWLVALWQA